MKTTPDKDLRSRTQKPQAPRGLQPCLPSDEPSQSAKIFQGHSLAAQTPVAQGAISSRGEDSSG